jgi:hypothetical protein
VNLIDSFMHWCFTATLAVFQLYHGIYEFENGHTCTWIEMNSLYFMGFFRLNIGSQRTQNP